MHQPSILDFSEETNLKRKWMKLLSLKIGRRLLIHSWYVICLIMFRDYFPNCSAHSCLTYIGYECTHHPQVMCLTESMYKQISLRYNICPQLLYSLSWYSYYNNIFFCCKSTTIYYWWRAEDLTKNMHMIWSRLSRKSFIDRINMIKTCLECRKIIYLCACEQIMLITRPRRIYSTDIVDKVNRCDKYREGYRLSSYSNNPRNFVGLIQFCLPRRKSVACGQAADSVPSTARIIEHTNLLKWYKNTTLQVQMI